MKEEAQKFLDNLKSLCQGLWFVSESDYPMEAFYWEDFEYEDEAISIDIEKILEYLGEDKNSKISEKSIVDFFKNAVTEKDWHSEEEKAEVEKFKKLVATLEENLENIQVILLGEIEIKAFVLGKTSFGGVAGVKTQLVQT